MIKVTVRTPVVPATLTLEMPGGGRGHVISVDKFSDKELDEVGTAWVAALKKVAAELRGKAEGAEGESSSETPPAEGAAKAEVKKPASRRRGARS